MTTILLAVTALNTTAAGPVTTGSLLHEMVTLSQLAEFPDPAYKTVQVSSYDRRSVRPYAPGWYANSDGFGGEPIPGYLEVLEEPNDEGVGRYLMADWRGPGALVRTWTAAINGDVTVILDGSLLYEGPAERFMMWTYSELAQREGIIEADVERGFHQNMACYFPIPFAESLRIEWTGQLDRLHFYHMEARLYEGGTQVHSFATGDLTTYSAEIERAIAILADTEATYPEADGTTYDLRAEVPAGGASELIALEGSQVIRELSLSVQGENLRRALRGVILKVFFDGAEQPQVESPLGDFFGAGPGLAPYDSLPFTVRPDGTMTCRFVMPFARSARIVVQNRSGAEATVEGAVNVASYEWNPESSLHFYAKWQINHDLEAQGLTGVFDLPYIVARGRGVLVGVACMLLNSSLVPTSGGNWWGEGDEKIWVDDDAFPSLFGTGSEDYYNYAWSRPDLFQTAYACQPLTTGPDNRGFVANNRFHILDPLPFQERLDFYMELFSHTHTPGISYGRIAYVYADDTLRDAFVPLTTLDVTLGLDLPIGWEPLALGAASGATFWQAEDIIADAGPAEVVSGEMWSGDGLVLLAGPSEGDSVQFAIDVPEGRRYQIVLTCALSPTSGRFSVSLDGADPMGFSPTCSRLHGDAAELLLRHPRPRRGRAHPHRDGPRPWRREGAGSDVGVDFVWIVPR